MNSGAKTSRLGKARIRICDGATSVGGCFGCLGGDCGGQSVNLQMKRRADLNCANIALGEPR